MSWIIYTFVCRGLSKPSYVVDYRAQKKKNVYIKCSAHNVFQWTTQSCQVQWTTQSCQVQWTTQSCQYNEWLSLVKYNERLSLVSTMNDTVLSSTMNDSVLSVQWTTQSCQYNERLSLVSTMNDSVLSVQWTDQSCQYNERLSLVSTMNGSVLSVQCVQWYINNNICFVNRPVYVRTQRLSHNRVVVRFTITYAKLNCACSMSVRDPVYSMQCILQEWQ
jgi:hypothetical protein